MMDKDKFRKEIEQLADMVENHLPKAQDTEWKLIYWLLKKIIMLLDKTYAETGGDPANTFSKDF